jgi:ATP-dependent helicase/DNAse subunit B
VDGFHRFSGARLELLAELASRIPKTHITLPAAGAADAWERGMLERTLAELEERFGLERVDLPGGDDLLVPDFLGGADRREEMERIAREIRFLVAEEGRRPGDFLVLFRDAAPYRSVLEDAFRAYRVPFRGRFQVAAAATPPGRSLLDCVRIGREGATRAAAEAFLKNRMFDVQEDRADAIAAAWKRTPEPAPGEDFLRRVGDADRGFATERIEPLVRLVAELGAARGGDRLRALRDTWLEWIDPSLAERAFPAGDLPLIGASVGRLVDLLDRLAGAADREPALRDVPREAAMALVEEEIRRAFVSYAAGNGSGVRVDDFRHGENLRAPVVFVAGLDAGLCPRAYDPGPLWNETDRDRLNRGGGRRVADRGLHTDEERFLFRRACSRATERLVLTAPAFRPDGKACAESPLRVELRRELGERVSPARDLGAVERFSGTRSIGSAADLLPFLASRADPAARDEEGVALAAALLARAGVVAPPGPRSFEDPVWLGEAPAFRRWIVGREEFSITELEDFFACPYRYLAKHVFRLDEPGESPEFAFAPALEGAVLHRACEEAVQHEAEFRDLLARAFEEGRASFPERLGHRLAEEAMRENVAALLEADLEFRREYGWTPLAFELRFGGAERKPVRIEGGLRIRGRIDRVDSASGGAILVIDYKRSVPVIAEVERGIEEGTSLALPLYLAAAEELLARRPAGAFLLSARETRRVGFFDASLAEQGIVPESSRRKSLMSLPPEAFRERIRLAQTSAVRAAAGIREGDFPVNPASESVCRTCPYGDLCRIVLAAREEETEE